jgi:hypothetical protein
MRERRSRRGGETQVEHQRRYRENRKGRGRDGGGVEGQTQKGRCREETGRGRYREKSLA